MEHKHVNMVQITGFAFVNIMLGKASLARRYTEPVNVTSLQSTVKNKLQILVTGNLINFYRT